MSALLALVLLLPLLPLLLNLLKPSRHRDHPGTSAKAAPVTAAAVRAPPVIPGLPLLGSALALGSGGAAFLHQCREKYGDTFTLNLAGQRMTFVFAPATLQHYFTAPDSQLTFAPAVQQFTHRVFGLPPKHFYHRHLVMLQALRHQLVPSALPQHTARLLRLLLEGMRNWPASGQLELVSTLKHLVFTASVSLLFGPQFLGDGGVIERNPGDSQGGVLMDLPECQEGQALQQEERQHLSGGGGKGKGGGAVSSGSSGSRGSGGPRPSTGRSRAEQLQDAFFTFEAGFELAASPVPHFLQPRFLIARRRLLAALRASHRAGHFEGTVTGSLIEACGLPERYVPNMLLAVLWASQANTVPSAFWSLGFLLLPENKHHLQAVVREAQHAVAATASTTLAPKSAAARSSLEASGGKAAIAAAAAVAASAGGESGSGARAASQPTSRAAPEPATRAAPEPATGCNERVGGGLLLNAAQQRSLAELAANRRSHAAAAVSEALRLRSFSVDVRIAAADGVLPCGEDGASEGIWVQKGNVVAISSYESHLDPRLFQPDPSAYNPNRPGMQLGGSTTTHAAVSGVGGVSGLSFGGGRYRCPGRYFAEAELALLTSVLLLLYDWQLLSQEGSCAKQQQGPKGEVVDAGQEAAGSDGGGAGRTVGILLGGNQQRQRRNADKQQQQQQQQGQQQQHCQQQEVGVLQPGQQQEDFPKQQQEAAPGDPAGLLPLPDLKRLVGIKIPAGPCCVQYQRRQLP